jgi:hypothetical protein
MPVGGNFVTVGELQADYEESGLRRITIEDGRLGTWRQRRWRRAPFHFVGTHHDMRRRSWRCLRSPGRLLGGFLGWFRRRTLGAKVRRK